MLTNESRAEITMMMRVVNHLQNNQEIQLCISDHADWNDILLTVEKVKPTQVWTNHGNGLQLKQHYENSLVVKLLN